MQAGISQPPALYGGLERFESDEDSIQGSPLLDTKPTFGSVSDTSLPPPVNARSSSLSHEYPSSGYENEDELYPAHGNQGRRAYERPPQQSLAQAQTYSPPRQSMRPVSVTQTYTPVDISPRRETAPPMGPLSGPPVDASTAPSGKLSTHREYAEEPEPTLTKDLARAQKLAIRAHRQSQQQTLQFANGQDRARPYSMLLRNTFENEPEELKRQSYPMRSVDSEVQDDDSLPFDVTTQQASQGRAASSLPALATGTIMSKSNFDNYRKSLQTLDMLKRQDSTFDAASKYSSDEDEDDDDVRGHLRRKHKKKDDDDSDVDDEEEPFEAISEKEHRRRMAKTRQEQDARMSIHRQRMSKLIVDGANIGPGPAPTPNTVHGETVTTDSVTDGEDEDDTIPLSILRAHGFPRLAKRPPPSSHGAASPVADASADVSTIHPAKSPQPHSRHNSMSGATVMAPRSPGQTTTYAASLATTSRLNLSGTNQHRPAPLPSLFGSAEQSMNRGLVAEIAKEEEARRRRQSMPFGAYGVPRGGDDSSSHVPTPNTARAPESLQSMNDKLSYLIEMLGNSNLNSPGVVPMSAPPVPMHQSMYGGDYRFQSMSMGPPGHRPASTYSMPVSMTSQAQYSAYNSSMISPRRAPEQYPSPRETSVSSEPATLSNHNETSIVSRGQVGAGNPYGDDQSVNDDDDDDDDDDDENDGDWHEMLSKRKNLRAQWQAQVELTSIRTHV